MRPCDHRQGLPCKRDGSRVLTVSCGTRVTPQIEAVCEATVDTPDGPVLHSATARAPGPVRIPADGAHLRKLQVGQYATIEPTFVTTQLRC